MLTFSNQRIDCTGNRQWEYNESRPHGALGERTPIEFAFQVAASRDLKGPEEAENSPWKWYKNSGPLTWALFRESWGEDAKRICLWDRREG